MRRKCGIGIRFGKENEMDKSIEWHLEHKRLGFYDPIAELYEELQAKAQLSEEDATFNAENVELNTTQDVQSVGSVGDYISRQAAIEETWKEPTYSDPINVLTEMRDRINEISSADVVEVVRCKDCKYWLPHSQFGFDEDNEEYHDYCERLVPEDDYYAYRRNADEFCSRAERRTDGEEIH